MANLERHNPKGRTVKLTHPNLGEVDLGLEQDAHLGETIADAKVAVTRKAFDERYQAGLDTFFQQSITSHDLEIGKTAAELVLEGQRQVLFKMLCRSALYSSAGLLGGAIAGFPLSLAALAIVPAVGAAIWMSKQ